MAIYACWSTSTHRNEGFGLPSGRNAFTLDSLCTGITNGNLGINRGSKEYMLKSSRSEMTFTKNCMMDN